MADDPLPEAGFEALPPELEDPDGGVLEVLVPDEPALDELLEDSELFALFAAASFDPVEDSLTEPSLLEVPSLPVPDLEPGPLPLAERESLR